MKTLRLVTLALLLAVPAAAGAQDTTAAPAADPADVASEDAIVAALYDVISGPAGEQRDWDRMRSLFVEGARLIPTGRGQDGVARHRVMTVEDYIATSGPFLEGEGFFEVELHRVSEQFGNVTHAFSTYESRHTAADDEPFARGINSIQLFNDGARWWVVSVMWDSERPDNPIPPKYLP